MKIGNRHQAAGNSRKARFCLRLLALLLLMTAAVAEAQQTKNVQRIGYLASTRGGVESTESELRQALRERGYIEGQHIVIERRSNDGAFDRLPGLIDDLIGWNVDIIVVTNIQGALAAKRATQTVPVVFAVAQDPVRSGLVASLAHPGGNLTGVTDFARELAGKRLELLKEAVAKISRVAILSWQPSGPEYDAERGEIESGARTLRVEIEPVEIKSTDQATSAIAQAVQTGANAFMALTDTRFAASRKKIIEVVSKNRLPAVYQDGVFVQDGGMMSYGTNRALWRRRVAYYVDRILKGAKPAELPVEQPKKFELIINLKAARQIGVTIPPNVLARADKVIR